MPFSQTEVSLATRSCLHAARFASCSAKDGLHNRFPTLASSWCFGHFESNFCFVGLRLLDVMGYAL